MKDLLFGEILETNFSIDKAQIEKALKFQREYEGKLGEILLNSGVISEEQISTCLSIQFGIKEIKDEIKEFSDLEFEPLLDIEPDWFIENEIIPLYAKNSQMFFVIKDPLNLYPIEIVNGIFSEYKISLLLADDRKYREILNFFELRYFKKGESEFDRNEIEKLKDLAAEAPIIKFVNSMLSRAAEYRASDIHLESHSNYLKIRYRIDGVLQDIDRVVAGSAAAIISRIKIMSNLDIGEKRLPQDGRIQIKVSGRLFDVRVSTLPTIYGENIVMRLLEKENINYEIDTLGLEIGDIKKIRKFISRNFGLILITGPTGSGKSTTLYSILNKLNTKERKIITVEDPVEYQIEGISQIHVHEQIGLSFATILRNILRQDPDIIMIGEIRDKETADIAIRASLTGHLVLATLHTNDSVSAITRLVDMGVEDYLVNSSLVGVVAQRLVRKVCPYCKTDSRIDKSIFNQLNIPEIQIKFGIKDFSFKKGKGCEMCANTGYRGRVGKEYEHLKSILMERNFKTLREDAVLKWLKGITTSSEVFRVT
jgi:type II secretory ATPase GspE/PulE/Tfp pilus assembly ATPase PilB-like protein